MENTENYTEIKAEEFLNLLYANTTIEIDGFSVYDNISIDINKIKGKTIRINSGYFQSIHIHNFNDDIQKTDLLLNGVNIHFFGGKFINLLISGGDFKDFQIFGAEFENINIIGGSFQNFNIDISGYTLDNFHISGGVFTSIFTINGGNFKWFSIKAGTFEQKINIYKGKFTHFEIEGGNFKNIFQIGYIEMNSILTFDLPARITGGDFNSILIESGEFKQGFTLGNIKIEKDCIFQAGIFKDITINDGFYNSIHFTNPTITGKVHFRKLLNAKFISFERLDVGINEIPELLFENCTIPTGTFIKINETHIENITFINSGNFGNIVFSGVKGTKNKETKQSTLKINNSDLGKTTFIDCDFEQMELDFRSSKITEVFLAGTKMPLKIKEQLNEKKELNLDQQRLGYGQLKKIYENRGDTVFSNNYFAKEMNAVYLDTAWSWENLGEKILLLSNQKSSNHGTSWLQALFATIMVADLFFMFYGWSIGLSCGNWSNGINWELFFNYWSYFLEFINPIHKANFIVEDMNKNGNDFVKTSNLSRVIENLARIFITYFIYQLIQAFRKHKKSST